MKRFISSFIIMLAVAGLVAQPVTQPKEEKTGRKKVAVVLCGGGAMGTIHIGALKVLEEAGFEIRQPGCSACLAMNDDKIPAGKLSVSTSNRNFEGRSGTRDGQIYLVSPETAAASGNCSDLWIDSQ